MQIKIKILSFLLLLFGVKYGNASHIFGGEIGYKHLSGNTYEINLTLFGDCSGNSYQNLFSSAPVILIYNGFNAYANITLSPYGIKGEEVTPVCPSQINNTSCKGGVLPGVARFMFKGNVTLNANSADWKFIFKGELGANNLAGRSGAITNIIQNGGYSIMQLEATLNNLAAPNNSSTYTTIPTPFFCINTAQQYNQGAVDSDNDALSFELVNGIDGNSGNYVTYAAPYTFYEPLAVSGANFSFNNNTGQLSFLPNATQNSLVVSQVTEKRNGVVVGTSMREMVFVVLNNCNNQSPAGGISANNSGILNSFNDISICNATSNLQFEINPIDPDGGVINVNFTNIPTGASITLTNNNTASPSLLFDWNIPNNIVPGDYTFYVTYQDDDCPLSSKQTIAYTIHYIQPITTNIATSSESCKTGNDGSIQVNASSVNGGFQYALFPNGFQNNNTFVNLSAGTYTITVKDNQNCTASFTSVVTLPVYPILNLLTKDINCYGGTDGSIEAQVSPEKNSYSFQFFPGNIVTANNIFQNLLQGSYTIIVTDTNGCKDTASASIAEPAPLIFDEVSVTPLTCNKTNGKIIVKTNFNNMRYKLIPTSFAIDTIGLFENLNAGTYTIVARNENDCMIDTVITVGVIPKTFSITTTKKDLPCLGKGDEGEAEAILTGGENPVSILWSSNPPQTGPVATYLNYGYYFVEATDATGCEVKDTVYIAPGSCCESVFFPTAFSPNNDGKNDEWHFVTSTGMEIEQYAIFDRWGQKVWFARDQRDGWNGKIGQAGDADMGTYYFLLRYKCLSDGKHYTKTGDLILVR